MIVLLFYCFSQVLTIKTHLLPILDAIIFPGVDTEDLAENECDPVPSHGRIWHQAWGPRNLAAKKVCPRHLKVQ